MKSLALHITLLVFMLLFSSYQRKKPASEKIRVKHDDVIVTHADRVKDTIDLKLSEILLSCDVVPLETKNESFISMAQRVAVSDNFIAIKDSERTPLKLFSRDGKYLRDIGAIGRGPDEYNISLYGVQIDEARKNLYLFPFAQARHILVFGFDGKAKKHIPLHFQQRKFKAYIDDDVVTVLGMPFKNDSAVAFQQTRDGKLLRFVAPRDYQLALEFSSEVSSSRNAGAFDIFQMIMGKNPRDTLYHYDVDANRLEPKFTIAFDSDEWPLYVCNEFPNHYYSWVRGRGNIVTDKRTLETHYFRLVNDFFGGIELKIFHQGNNGMFISSISALNLKKELKRCMSDKSLSPQVMNKLAELDSKIDENSNDILFIGRFK
jgi:hypothetical protein